MSSRGLVKKSLVHLPETTIWEKLREPSLTALVIVEGFILFVQKPLGELDLSSAIVNSIATLLLIGSALLVVSGKRLATIVILFPTIGAVIADVLAIAKPSAAVTYVDVATKLVLMATLTWVIGLAVFGPGRVTYHRILGAIAVYFQIAMLFAYAYVLIVLLVPGAFHASKAWSGEGVGRVIYFSLATLTTTGYGDIVPLHPIAQSLANLEAVIGQLFPAVLLARLVSLHASNPKP